MLRGGVCAVEDNKSPHVVKGRDVYRVVVQFCHWPVRLRPQGLHCGAVEQFVLDATWGSICRTLGEDAHIRVHKVRLVNMEADVTLVAYSCAAHVHGQ